MLALIARLHMNYVYNNFKGSYMKAQITQLVEWTIEAGYVVGSSPALSNGCAGMVDRLCLGQSG